MEKISSLDKLKELAYNKNFECLICLNGGAMSRKIISYDPDEVDSYRWAIYNHIDDSEERYDSDEEFEEHYSLFFEAIGKGALIYDPKNCFV